MKKVIDKQRVFALRALGLTERVIAERLGCAKSAIHFHLNPEYAAKRAAAKRRRKDGDKADA